MKFLAGAVVRSCASDPVINGNQGLNLISFFQNEGFEGLQEHRAGRNFIVTTDYCDDKDLCNGTGRLAAISTMMILFQSSLVLLISLFSRL